MVHEDELRAGVSSTQSCLCLGQTYPNTNTLDAACSVDICLYDKSIVEIVGGRDEFLPIMCDRGRNSGIELGSELCDQVCWELNKAAMLIDGCPGDSEWILEIAGPAVAMI